MKPGPLPAVDVARRHDRPGRRCPVCGPLPTRLGVTGAAPGRAARPWSPSARPAPGGARCSPRLLGLDPACSPCRPAAGCVVRARPGAHPGGVRARLPPAALLRRGPAAAGPALARPPRRVELSLPEPLLRHFAWSTRPDTGTLGVAGGRVLLDAAGRAGALLFVIAADQAFTAAELHLLAEVARDRGARSSSRSPPARRGWAPVADGTATTEGAGASVAAGRARGRPTGGPGRGDGRGAPGGAAGRGAGAGRGRWFPVAAADTAADLRRALVGWAAARGCAGRAPTRRCLPGQHGRVAGGRRAGRLVRAARPPGPLLRPADPPAPRPGAGEHPPAGRPGDRLRGRLRRPAGAARPGDGGAVAAGHRPVRRGGARASSTTPPPGSSARRWPRACGAGSPPPCSWGLADHRAGHELDRVLLVTSTAGVAELTGAGAVDALRQLSRRRPVTRCSRRSAVALSGGCWQHWRSPGNDDPSAARAWAQRALREVELELSREMSRRFEVVRLSLGVVLSDAVDHGILLA